MPPPPPPRSYTLQVFVPEAPLFSSSVMGHCCSTWNPNHHNYALNVKANIRTARRGSSSSTKPSQWAGKHHLHHQMMMKSQHSKSKWMFSLTLKGIIMEHWVPDGASVNQTGSRKFVRKGQKKEATAGEKWICPSSGQCSSTPNTLSEADFGQETHHSTCTTHTTVCTGSSTVLHLSFP